MLEEEVDEAVVRELAPPSRVAFRNGHVDGDDARRRRMPVSRPHVRTADGAGGAV